MIQYPFNAISNLNELKKKYPESSYILELDSTMVSHATSIKNAYLISKEKKILSYAKLQKQNPKIVANNYLTTTDIFDIELGLHNYVFGSIGRGTLSDLAQVFFCFPMGKLNGIPNALASTIEIAECGAIVSKESENIYLKSGCTKEQILSSNKGAKSMFFKNLVPASEFNSLFNGFLSKHYSDYISYLQVISYPEAIGNHSIIPEGGRRQGPQLMVPHQLPLEDNLYGILDLYGATLKHSDRNRVINVTDLIKKSSKKELNSLLSSLEIKKNTGETPANLAIFINLLMYFLSNLHLDGYNGKLSDGILDQINKLSI